MIWQPGISSYLFRKPASGGGPSVPVPTVYWEADSGIVTTTNGTTADASPVSGNKVLSWTSKDASATVASYATNSQRPTYYAPSWGKPYVTFDGTASNRLETTAFNSTFNGASQYTIGISFRKAAAYSGYRNEVLMAFNTTDVHGMLKAGPGGSGYAMFGGGSSRVYMAYSGELSGECTLFSSFSTAGTSSTAGSSITKMYMNGVLVQSDTITTATTNISDRITLGGTTDPTNSKTKDVYGFYLYSTQLTDAQVLTVNNDIKSRLFTLTLPVSGAALWLDASKQWNLFDTTALANNLYSNGGAIGQWNDLSGNAQNAQQTSSANRPTWLSPANGQNGLGAVAFNGTSSKLTGLPISTSSTYTLYFVYKYNAGGTTYPPVFFNGNSGSNGYGFGRYSTNRTVLHGGKGFAQDGVMPTTWESAQISRSSGAFTFYVNGTSTTIGTLASYNAPTAQFSIGSCFDGTNWDYLNGQIGEIILYPTAHSSTDVATNYNYLKAKWGTP